MDIFAYAFDGNTVLAPSPTYPPQTPLTSNEGLIEFLSLVVYPSSPYTSLMSKSFLYSFNLKGALAI